MKFDDVNYFKYNQFFEQKLYSEKENDVKILQANFNLLKHAKFSKIQSALSNLKNKKISLKDAIEVFKKNLSQFNKYYLFYEQSDSIFKKYKNDDLCKLFHNKEDFYQIKKQINLLNDIKIREIYENVKNQIENENQDIENIDNNGEEKIELVNDLLHNNEAIERRKEELEEIERIKRQIMQTKKAMELDVNQQSEALNQIEKNVENELAQSYKSEVLVKDNKEVDEKFR